jgi:hypothetical protein
MSLGYLVTSATVLKFRRAEAESRARPYKMPMGNIVALVATLGSTALILAALRDPWVSSGGKLPARMDADGGVGRWWDSSSTHKTSRKPNDEIPVLMLLVSREPVVPKKDAASYLEHAKRLHRECRWSTPTTTFPEMIHEAVKGDLSKMDPDGTLKIDTDIPRLKAGLVGGPVLRGVCPSDIHRTGRRAGLRSRRSTSSSALPALSLAAVGHDR